MTRVVARERWMTVLSFTQVPPMASEERSQTNDAGLVPSHLLNSASKGHFHPNCPFEVQKRNLLLRPQTP